MLNPKANTLLRFYDTVLFMDYFETLPNLGCNSKIGKSVGLAGDACPSSQRCNSSKIRFPLIPGLPVLPSLHGLMMPNDKKTQLLTKLVHTACEFYDVDPEHVYIYRTFGQPSDYDRKVSAAVSCVIYTFRCLDIKCSTIAKILDRSKPTISTNTYRLRLKVIDSDYFDRLHDCLGMIREIVVASVAKHEETVSLMEPESFELELSGVKLLRAKKEAEAQNLTLRDYILMHLSSWLQV